MNYIFITILRYADATPQIEHTVLFKNADAIFKVRSLLINGKSIIKTQNIIKYDKLGM